MSKKAYPENNVHLLKSLKDDKINEEDVLEIFSRYSDDMKFLTPNKLTIFLQDILATFDAPQIVSAAMFENVRSELALSVRRDKKISLTEFKSHFMYFNERPIQAFLDSLKNSFLISFNEFKYKTAVLSFVLSYIDSEKTSKVDEELIKDEIDQILGGETNCGRILQCFVFISSLSNLVECFLIFEDENDFEAIRSKVESQNGIFILENKTKICRFNGHILPRREKKDFSAAAKTAAKGLLFGAKSVEKARSFVEESGLQKRGEDALKNLNQFANNVDKNYEISGKLQYLGDSASNLARKTSEKANSVDENLGISRSLQQVKGNISKSAESLSENPTVKSGLNYVSSWYNTLYGHYNDFKNETMQIYEMERDDQNGPVENGNKNSDKNIEKIEKIEKISEKINENDEKIDEKNVKKIDQNGGKNDEIDQKKNENGQNGEILEKLENSEEEM